MTWRNFDEIADRFEPYQVSLLVLAPSVFCDLVTTGTMTVKLVAAIRVTTVCGTVFLSASSVLAQKASVDVPVTIKELDVNQAIQEFRTFQDRLGSFRNKIRKGKAVARETAQILDELRASANAANGHNEKPILEAITNYVDGVLNKQVELVDFLESQRYRISYYANKMASSVRPEQLAVLFGTEKQNDLAITARVRDLAATKEKIAAFVDGLPAEQFDRELFRPLRSMPAETRRTLDVLLYRYQQAQGQMQFAKRRLQIVRAGQRAASGARSSIGDIDADLLIGQMFGALDIIRLQMSQDLLNLEQMLGAYTRSAQAKEILSAFQNLMEMQGNLEGPSSELASVLDWLQDSSVRRLSLSAIEFSRPGLKIPRYSELLREAYEGARSDRR